MNQLFVEKFALIAELVEAKSWLQIQADLGLAENTIAAYGRALEDYLGFCKRSGLTPKEVTREQIVAYIHDLRTRPGKKGAKVKRIDSGAGLSNATMQQMLTAVRLFYDYLIEGASVKSILLGEGVTLQVRLSVERRNMVLFRRTGDCRGFPLMRSGKQS